MKRIGIAAVLVSAIVGIALGVVYHGYPQAALKAINIAYEWRAGVEEKLPGRQHELYNEKQTKVHLNS